MNIGTLSLKNKSFLAPMAGVTDLAFRTLARECGCALAFTEMVNATGLVRGMKKTEQYLESEPDDRPLGIQLFGTDPAILAEASRIATERGADLIDLNMGCPVKKVIKTGAGAALMREPALVAQIVQAVREATRLPITVKIRSGWRRHEINALEIALIAADMGADAIVVHPRTADQGFSGSADWDVIRQVKAAVPVAVIGNGDIRQPEDALRMIAATACDGIMVGRGALGNPWIFRGINALLKGDQGTWKPDLAERKKAIIRHLDMDISRHGERFAVRSFRKHLLWYTKGLRGGSQFRQLAGALREQETLILELDLFFRGLSMAWNSDK